MTHVQLLIDSMFTTDMAVFFPEGPHASYVAASKSLLIVSEREKILVDTGIGDIPRKPAYGELRKKVTIERREGQGIENQLAKHGLTMKDITSVVNTHLHVAHAGNNYLLDHAKFYIGGDEFRFIDKKLADDPKQTAYVPEAYDRVRDVTLVKGTFHLTDDVRIVPTPGHTGGHQSVVIEQNGKTLVYCGDVFPLRDNLTKHMPMTGYDRGQLMKSMDSLYQDNRNAAWLFSHDGMQLEATQAFETP
jgi:N-acyl homoserine lactone hydrolase